MWRVSSFEWVQNKKVLCSSVKLQYKQPGYLDYLLPIDCMLLELSLVKKYAIWNFC